MKTPTRLLLSLAVLAGLALPTPCAAACGSTRGGSCPDPAGRSRPGQDGCRPAWPGNRSRSPWRSALRRMISATRRGRSSAGRSTSCAPRPSRSGWACDLRPTTFDTLIPGLQAKRFDAATGQMGVTVVREKVVDMIGTLTSNELFAAYADSPIMVKTLDDLCGVTVATTRGSREMVFADEHQPKVRGRRQEADQCARLQRRQRRRRGDDEPPG